MRSSTSGFVKRPRQIIPFNTSLSNALRALCPPLRPSVRHSASSSVPCHHFQRLQRYAGPCHSWLPLRRVHSVPNVPSGTTKSGCLPVVLPCLVPFGLLSALGSTSRIDIRFSLDTEARKTRIVCCTPAPYPRNPRLAQIFPKSGILPRLSLRSSQGHNGSSSPPAYGTDSLIMCQATFSVSRAV